MKVQNMYELTDLFGSKKKVDFDNLIIGASAYIENYLIDRCFEKKLLASQNADIDGLYLAQNDLNSFRFILSRLNDPVLSKSVREKQALSIYKLMHVKVQEAV